MSWIHLLALSTLSLVSGSAPVQQDKTAKAESVAAILDAMEAAQGKLVNARVVLDMRMSLPVSDNVAGVAAKPLKLSSTATIRMIRNKAGYHARMDVDMQTSRGLLHIESLRTPQGIWIHQASRMVGESWLQIDKKLMSKLKRAAELLGSSGAMQQAGTSNPGAFLGSGLLKGLSRSYDMTLGRSIVVNEVDCHRIVLKLRKKANLPLSMRRERPSDIHVFIGKKDLIMRKMVQMVAERTIFSVELLTLNLSANIKTDDLVIDPPKGSKFVDIMEDQLASRWIREILHKLRQAERDLADKKTVKENAAAKKGEEVPPKKK